MAPRLPSPTPADPKSIETLRNRASQRRTRQRRREYISSLEQRIQKFEREGAQASVALQAAARQVADENRALKEILRGVGFGQERVQAMLDGRVSVKDGIGGSAGSLPFSLVDGEGGKEMMGRVSRKGSLCPKSVDENPVVHHGDEAELDSDRGSLGVSNNIAPSSTCSSLLPIQRRPDGKRGPDCGRPPSRSKPPNISLNAGVHSNTGPGSVIDSCRDQMSCVEAAQIIALMRGSGCGEDIWCELGCSATRHVVVKNSTVMSLASQE